MDRNWKIKSINEICHLISGAHLNPDQYNSNGIGIPYFTGPTDYTNKINQIKKWSVQSNAIAVNGDNLITVKGSGVGSLHQLELDEVAIGRQIMAVRIKDNYCSKYIYYCLCELEYSFKELAKGNMIPGLTRSDILSSKILIPSYSQQKAIAQIINTWDTAIQKTQALIAQKELRKKWLMQNLLTGKKRLKGFKNKWKMQPLENCIAPITREIPKPNTSYLGIGLRSHGKGTFLKPDEQPEKNSMDKFYIVRPNDLIVNITFAWEQAIAIVRPEDDGALASHRFPTYTFIQEKGHDNFFRFYILQSRMKHMLELISPGGAGRNRVMSKSDFIKLEFLLPEFEEQKAIADILLVTDKEIKTLKSKVEKLKEQKNGLMQQLLTGKKRLKPNNENNRNPNKINRSYCCCIRKR